MDINNFGPFHSQVWGTVMDVVMTTATVITAIFLYKTFRSQIAVQRLQQSITDIENERYRVEYKPIFEITPFEIKKISESEGRTNSSVSFKLKHLAKDVKNLDIIGKSGTGNIERISFSQKHTGIHLPITDAYSPNEYNLTFSISTLSVLFDSEGSYFLFYLHFCDSIGNCYRQLFTISFKDTFLFFSEKHPERVHQTL